MTSSLIGRVSLLTVPASSRRRLRRPAECLGQKRWMNPRHREDLFRSAGLDLFQELSTLDQQLTRTLLLCSRRGRIEPVLPALTPRPRQPPSPLAERVTRPVFLLWSPKKKTRVTFSVTRSVANSELLVAKQNSGRNPHVVVVGGSIGVQREPVKLGCTQRDMLRRPDVQSATEHHGKSVGRAR